LSEFNKTSITHEILSKDINISNFMKIRLVGTEVFRGTEVFHVDGRAWRHFAKAPKMKKLGSRCYNMILLNSGRNLDRGGRL
jgi:hypothetical protein